ncbi:carboxymuconolactone decarboxylase family protein [Gammaproteobacteria bacterium]|nr:carboxymuconolactone decarboxylase family protein [Gammaproteobacteria bacterium]MDC0577328.1 carboxymuconolactone decarboxylase family protein [Gammaproteobacteria bacterium]MDC0590788.1 carboxymuconolactone decarboxylase family protein [Gammaproteobacteria bacterium]
MKEKNNNNSFIGESKRESYKDFENLFQGVESFMGYLPNAHLAMAERPELLMAFSGLASTVFQAEGIDIQTKQLIALASSLSSGCKYCQAHTSHGAERAGMKEEKIADILNYPESKNYTDKEKALLDLAFAAGVTPNKSTQSHFDNLKKYFSKKEIIDIVSVIALFGFLNRWNDTMGTVLEEVPESFVENKLRPLGWS